MNRLKGMKRGYGRSRQTLQEERMTFDVHQIGTLALVAAPSSAVLTHPGGNGFAAVYDLEAKRGEAAHPVIPDELWDEVDAAARTAADLDRAGHALRFDRRLDGRLVARLYDDDGSVVRRLSLSEVIDVGSSDPQEAA
jgi:hypothetical protein